MRNVSLREPDVNSGTPDPPGCRRRSPRLSAVLLTLLAILILILATACGNASGQPAKTNGSAFLVLSFGALICALLLLNTVGKLMGRIFDLTLDLLKVIAAVGFTAALVIAAVILAVAATAAAR